MLTRDLIGKKKAALIAFQRAFKMLRFCILFSSGSFGHLRDDEVKQKSLTGYLSPVNLKRLSTTVVSSSQVMTPPPSPLPLTGAPWRVPLGGRRSTSVGGIAYRRVEPSATKRRGAYRSPWRLSLPQTHPPHPRSAVLTAWTRGINPPLTMCAGTARRVRTGGVWERVKGRGAPRVRERGVGGCTHL